VLYGSRVPEVYFDDAEEALRLLTHLPIAAATFTQEGVPNDPRKELPCAPDCPCKKLAAQRIWTA